MREGGGARSLTLAFPRATSRRVLRPGRLLLAEGLQGAGAAFGAFEVAFESVGQRSGAGARLVVRVAGGSLRPFATVPGRACLGGARGEYWARGRAGHLRPGEAVSERYPHQFVASLSLREVGGRPGVELDGFLLPTLRTLESAAGGEVPSGAVRYALRFYAVDGERVGVEAELGAEGLFTDLFWEQPAEARVFGFGAQYTYVDMRGRAVPILTAEQGVGRGAQPLTRFAEALGGAGGEWWSTYAPVPGFIATDGRGLMLKDTAPCRFDLRQPGLGSVRLYAPSLRALAYAAPEPGRLMELHTRETGRMAPLPDWAHSGAIVGLQGGEGKVEAVVEGLLAAGVEVAGVWLQDWVGNRQVPFGTRLWWDWQRNEDRYPDWHGMRERLAARGVRLLAYVNPFLAPMDARPGGRPALFDEALAAGHFVKGAGGEAYLTDQGDFTAGLIDLSSAAARAWYLKTLARNLAEAGVHGWMADFGEGLPLDAGLAGGAALAWHNRYPEAWAEFNAELRELVAKANGEQPGEYLTFFRSGFTRSPRHAGLFWLGDQTVTWDRFDGLASALTGLLTGGFSGFALNHGDVGGYTSTLPPLPSTRRTPELLARWGELMAFTVLLRSHEGNRPGENVQVYTDASTRAAFAGAARLHASWRGLRVRLMEEAFRTGMPVVRHAWLQYPGDPVCLDLTRQYFLGPDLLVAPVLEPGASSVSAYLPTGSGAWRHRFTEATFEAGDGAWVDVPAPLGQPGLFDRLGSTGGEPFSGGGPAGPARP